MADYLAEYRDIDITAVITMRDGVQFSVPASDVYGYSISGTAAYSGLPIGEAIANSFSLSVSIVECPYSAEQLDSAEVHVRIGLRHNTAEAYEYSPAGVWYVTGVDAPEGGNAVTLNGVDALGIWFDRLFVDNAATYPQPMRRLLDTLAISAGVTLSPREWLHADAAIETLPVWDENITLRTAVGYIAACAGGFAQIDMSGKLEIVTTGWGDELPINTAAYNTFTPTGGSRFRLNALQVVYPITDEDAETPDTVRYAYDTAIEDNATNCIVIEGNPLLTDAMAGAIMKELHRYEFVGGDLTWIGSPAVNCGSIVQLTPIDGNLRTLYVNRRELTFDGGLTGEVSSTMPTLHDTSAHYTSSGRVFNSDGTLPVTKIEGFAGAVVNAMVGKFDRIIAGDVTTDKLYAQIGQIVQLKVDNLDAGSIHGDKITAGTIGAEQLEAKSITADKIAAGSVTADKLAAGAVTADKIAAFSITGNKIASDTITARNIQSGTITADLIAAKTITADSGVIDDAAIGTAQIADGSITSAKIVELSADLIKAGTLSAERILIAGDDGIIYRINATSSGLSLSQLRDDQYKNYINGTVIVAKSITAAQIAAETITANEILSGTITAKQLNVTEVFANNAVIDAISTNVIRGNGYLQLIVSDAVDEAAAGLQAQIDMIPEKIELAVSDVTATGLKTGSGVSITKDEVTITSPKTKVTIPLEGSEDEAEIVSIDEDGLRADVITADEINSPSVVRVAAAANYAPASAGELQTLLMEITGHFMSGDITIDASAVTAGIFAIKGLHGYGVLTISGGSFNRVSVTDCSCRIVFDSVALATDGTAVEASNAKVLLKNVAFTAVEGLHAHHYAHVDMTSCTGECKTLLRSTDCAVVCVNGDTCPAGLPGELSGGGELYSTLTFAESVQEPDEGETGVVTTATIAAKASRSWSSSWLSTSTFGTALYQGRYGENALRRGCMWFDTEAITGRHIISATLTLKRVSGVGGGGAVSVGIYGTTATGASGAPAIGTKYASVSISNGGKATVDVTTAVQDLADGNIGGLMTYDTRTNKISGKTYTVGYCKMYGAGEADAPVLEVTYE
jgi:hypothetical protein